MGKFQQRVKKEQKGMSVYIYLVLLVSIAAGALINAWVDNIISAISGGTGFFFLVLLFTNYYSTRRYAKEGIHTWATVTGCERMESKGEEGDGNNEYYYKITYEIMYEGELISLGLPSFDKAKVGKSVNGYYVPEMEVFRSDAEIKDLRSNVGLRLLIVSCFVIAVVAALITNIGAKYFAGDVGMCAMAYVVGIVFSGAGFCMAYAGVMQKRKMEIGSVSEINILHSGNIREKEETKTSFVPGIIFGVLGMGMLATAIYLTLQGFSFL